MIVMLNKNKTTSIFKSNQIGGLQGKIVNNYRFPKTKLYPGTFFTTFIQSLNHASQYKFKYARHVAMQRLNAHGERFWRQRGQHSWYKSTTLTSHVSSLNYLILYLKKSYLDQETQKTVWKGRFGGVRQSRFFKQVNRSRILPRLFQRIFKPSVLRLRFFYVFDMLILWVYFFFRKIASFSKSFFYENWCNLYFFLVAGSTSRVVFNTLLIGRADAQSFFENYFLSNKIKAKGLSNSKFAILTLHSFTNLFKLMCVFWNKRKSKHYIFRLSSRRWKKKFRSLKRKGKKKKYIPFWKKIKTRRFFIPRKILRLKFRRQHGYKAMTDYFLRVQVRRLKPKLWKKSVRAERHSNVLLNILTANQNLTHLDHHRSRVPLLSFGQLYKHLIANKIKLRRLLKAKQRAKNRRIKGVVNRRKLLLAVNFKTILSRAKRSPLFCFSMPRRNLIT